LLLQISERAPEHGKERRASFRWPTKSRPTQQRGCRRVELAVVKRCLRRIYGNMKNRPAAASRSRQKRVAI
jgi:hypothetical protein